MLRFSFCTQGAALVALALALVACSSTPPVPEVSAPPPPEARSPPPSTTSKYYKDDGPGDSPPANLEQLPDATPRHEPLNRFTSRPYTVLGRDYVPATSLRPYKERGIASWYGRKFHGQKTATGEIYDMYAMTAAHPTLPLPSYARVTSVATGRSVVVRINDRGPFLHGRIIDLSYAAAHRIGIASRGSGEVIVESIMPGDSRALDPQPPLPPAAPPPPPDAGSVVTTPLRSVDAPVSVATVRAPPVAAPVPSATQAAAPRDNVVTVSPPLPVVAINRDTARSLSAQSSPDATTQRKAATAFAVQLGAFQNSVNAQNFLAHVQAQLASAQVEPKVREANGVYRVFVGPYGDRDEARRVAERITKAFGVATTIAPH